MSTKRPQKWQTIAMVNELLEMENSCLKAKVERLKAAGTEIIRRTKEGCGNHGCRMKKPEGMAPNGPCRCTPNSLKKLLEGTEP